MLGRSPRSVAPRSEDSRGRRRRRRMAIGGSSGRATGVRVPSEVPSREAPPSRSGASLAWRGTYSDDARRRRTRRCWRGRTARRTELTRVRRRRGETTPRRDRASGRTGNRNLGRARRRARPPHPPSRGGASWARRARRMEAMRVSDGGGGDGSGDSPTKSETGAKLSALKRRQELSRDSSRKSRETSREGSLARANSLPTGTMTRRSTAEPPAKAKEDARRTEWVRGPSRPGGGVRTPSGSGVRPTG